jgi:integrase
MRTRHQKGYLYKKGNLWLLRYYDNQELPDGTITRIQKAHKLVEAVGEYRTKAAVRELAQEFLAPMNDSRMTPQSVMSLGRFVEGRYLPYVEKQKRTSTFHGYRNVWKGYLQPHGGIALRDFKTADVECVLETIADENNLTSTTLQHIKAFLSGVFRYAKRMGVIHTENPVRDAVLPKAKPGEDTYAYSLEEIARMLQVLPEPAATIVAAASYTGARKGELRGFRWEDYYGEHIRISQSYWRSHREEPKTRKSRATVPVITQLAERLNLHRELTGNPSCGLMFQSAARKPLNLDALAADVIRPAFKQHELEWHGWHAFRRGLATDLHRLGVSDETIQRLLRHSTVAVTQNCYIKTADADAVAAMRTLQNAPSMHLASSARLRIM